MDSVNTGQRVWSVLPLVEWTAAYLAQKEIDSPRLTAELLLSHVLHCRRIELYTNFDRPLTADELARFKGFLRRRLAHEPLQYIMGETEFMGMRIAVDTRALIPRPETEILVEAAVKHLSTASLNGAQILDIGTGTGCIVLALAKFLPTAALDALDASADALALARENVEYHRLDDRIRLIQGDFLQDDCFQHLRRYELIVSNPPYISMNEYIGLAPEIRDYEPAMAATDSGDGLTFYRRIAACGDRLLNPQGWIMVEIAYNQSESVTKIFELAGYSNMTVIPDYDRIGRVVKAQVR